METKSALEPPEILSPLLHFYVTPNSYLYFSFNTQEMLSYACAVNSLFRRQHNLQGQAQLLYDYIYGWLPNPACHSKLLAQGLLVRSAQKQKWEKDELTKTFTWYFFFFHSHRCHAVSNKCGRDLLIDKLISSQPGSLVIWPCLCAIDMLQMAQSMQGANNTCKVNVINIFKRTCYLGLK